MDNGMTVLRILEISYIMGLNLLGGTPNPSAHYGNRMKVTKNIFYAHNHVAKSNEAIAIEWPKNLILDPVSQF